MAGQLPAPTADLIGREDELAQLVKMLVVDGHRLVTVTGLGGSGKTRLAVEAGWQVRSRFSEGQRLPGYWCTPPGSRDPGPTLVAMSGFDGTLEETYLEVGRAALERGWRVLLVCGPGQMDVTRTENRTFFVPDTERWVSPWLDLALEQPEVDPARVALLGISYGGYLVTRAAGHDHRVSAVVANSPIIDLRAYLIGFVAPWIGGDPEEVLNPSEDLRLDEVDSIPGDALPVAAKEMACGLMTRFGCASLIETFRYLREFRADPGAIACPALALVGTGEGAEPTRQHEAFGARSGGPVRSHIFSAEDGADSHCQFGNLAYSAAVIFDWLDETLRPG